MQGIIFGISKSPKSNPTPFKVFKMWIFMNDRDLSKEKWDEQWLLATSMAPK
jgi:hypothetical protein